MHHVNRQISIDIFSLMEYILKSAFRMQEPFPNKILRLRIHTVSISIEEPRTLESREVKAARYARGLQQWCHTGHGGV